MGRVLEWLRLGLTLVVALAGHLVWPSVDAAPGALALLIERFSAPAALIPGMSGPK